MPTHATTGALGIFGYTGDGISKSLDRAVHRKTMKAILAAKRSESEYVMRDGREALNISEVAHAFLQHQESRVSMSSA